MLCEGTSINTVSKRLVDAGKFCAAFHEEMVRNVNARRVQADEIWSFIGAKAKNVTPELLEKNCGGRRVDLDLVGARDGFALNC